MKNFTTPFGDLSDKFSPVYSIKNVDKVGSSCITGTMIN